MKFIRWVRDYWYVPLIVIGGIFAIVWLRGRGKDAASIVSRVTKEVAAIASKREARDMKIQLGHEQAKQHVMDKYREKRKGLDAKQEARVKELEDDPEALALALERLTSD